MRAKPLIDWTDANKLWGKAGSNVHVSSTASWLDDAHSAADAASEVGA